MNKEPRLRFTDEERSDPALEKPIRKAEKAAARADKAQANIPKKKVRQTVIDPDTGKKTSKLTFEDKKNHLPNFLKGLRKLPSIWSRASFTKRSGKQNRTMWAWKAPTSPRRRWRPALIWCREGYRSHKLKPYRKSSPGRAEAGKGKCKCPVPEVPTGKSSVYQQPSLPLAAKTEYLKSSMPSPSAPVRLPEIPPRLRPKPEKPQGR